jgi:Fic family protein
MTEYVMRHGKRIEVEVLDSGVTQKKRRKPFKAQWVKLPRQWVEALRRSKSMGTYQLALAILFEAFKREHCGGEIVLSSAVTKMPRSTRRRATKELVKLGLIKTHKNGSQSPRVSHIYYY